jgi:hypothetical protein
MAYDPAQRVVLMYGGATEVGGDVGCAEVGYYPRCYLDTWEWDGLDWHRLSPQQSPGPWGTMAFDDSSHTMLYYDGNVWGWTEATWNRLSASSQSDPAPAQAQMTFDPATNAVIIFGGISLSGADRRKMWRWDGRIWVSMSTSAPSLSPTPGASIARDMDRHVIIAFQSGQYFQPGTAGQTWRWDGSTWARLEPVHEPATQSVQLFADPSNHRLLLVDGVDFAVWAWDGVDWTPVD